MSPFNACVYVYVCVHNFFFSFSSSSSCFSHYYSFFPSFLSMVFLFRLSFFLSSSLQFFLFLSFPSIIFFSSVDFPDLVLRSPACRVMATIGSNSSRFMWLILMARIRTYKSLTLWSFYVKWAFLYGRSTPISLYSSFILSSVASSFTGVVSFLSPFLFFFHYPQSASSVF